MNYSKNILGEKISYQESAKALIISRELTIDEVLKSIKECQYSSIVDRLRKLLNNNEEQKYRDEKKNLPAVCFCGTFNKSRSKENLKQYNNLIVIDLDKLNSEEMQRLKSCFEADDYIYSFWLSPSGKGFKGLVALDYKFNISQYDIHECHRAAFVKLSQYFFEKYSVELDQQCKDIPRLCFVSADRELHLKQKIEYFPVLESDLAKKVDNSTQKKQGAVRRHHVKRTTQGVTISPDVLLNPSGKNSPQDRYRIQSIIKYLSKRKRSITTGYENWYRVAFAISNTFTHDIGEKYYIKLCRLDGAGHDEEGSKKMLKGCYVKTRKEISLKTILHLAKLQGYKNSGEGSSEDGGS